MWDRQGGLEGGTSGKERGRWIMFGARHADEGRERGESSNIPFSLYCCVFSVEKYRHTQTHVQPFPILFITVSSFLNECLGGEKRGGIVMEGEKELLLGK